MLRFYCWMPYCMAFLNHLTGSNGDLPACSNSQLLESLCLSVVVVWVVFCNKDTILGFFQCLEVSPILQLIRSDIFLKRYFNIYGYKI